jgi:L-asparagine oxygenase
MPRAGQRESVLLEAIDGWAAAKPSSPAITSPNEQITYTELQSQCRRLANSLGQLTPPQARVALLFDHPADYVVAMIAALMSGRCFVPFDARYDTTCPLADIHTWLGKSGDIVFGSHSGQWYCINELQSLEETEPTHEVITLEEPAYVLFTSGSSGKAKGVEILRRNLDAYIPAISDRLDLNRSDRWMQFASPSFDVFIEETLPILFAGGTLLCAESLSTPAFSELHNRLEATGATVIELPTRYWCEYTRWLEKQCDAPPSSLRLVIVGGEQMPVAPYRAWQSAFPEVKLAHVYGVTEATISSTIFDGLLSDDAAFVPVGQPIASASVTVDEGELGEIVISGPAVGAGYVNDAAATALKFTLDHDQQRYRTGDLGFFWEGHLVITGRADDEVKIDGHRVTLGDIERDLREASGLDVSLVQTGNGQLAAFFPMPLEPTQGDCTRMQTAIRCDIESKLSQPPWARPNEWLCVRQLPQNAHGKVDKTILLQWLHACHEALPEAALHPLSDLEKTVLAAFRDGLDQPGFGFDDDFFEFGGDSLSALSIATALEDWLPEYGGTETLVDAPSPAAMSEVCKQKYNQHRCSREPVLHLADDEACTLSKLAGELALQFHTSDDQQFIPAVRSAVSEIPRRISDEVLKMAEQGEQPYLIVRGHHIDQQRIGPTPGQLRTTGAPCAALAEEGLIAIYSELIGRSFCWPTQQDGRLVHDVMPVKKDEFAQLGTGSRELLTWHTEDAFHPRRADFMLLFALRNPQEVPTAIGVLDHRYADQPWYNVLFEERFEILPDESHLPSNNSADIVGESSDAFQEIAQMYIVPSRVSILSGDKARPKLRLDPYFMTPVPGDTVAENAFTAVVEAIERDLRTVSLQAGDLLILNNARAVHGRLPFRARFDGTDRWLKRLNVHRAKVTDAAREESTVLPAEIVDR